MKKFTALLICLLLLLPVAASAEGWIANATFSEEETALMRLLRMDEGFGPYDFQAPEGATQLTLTAWTIENDQWTQRLLASAELTQPKGRIYIDWTHLPNSLWLVIQPADQDFPVSRGSTLKEPFNTIGMHRVQRTFHYAEDNQPYQERIMAVLNEPTLLELYTCSYESVRPLAFSAFADPANFAQYDYVLAVTATFTAEED